MSRVRGRNPSVTAVGHLSEQLPTSRLLDCVRTAQCAEDLGTR